jgi:four helix bundle protein
MKNFKELKIWQRGFKIAVNSFEIVKAFPSEQKFGLGIQLTKAGVSIPSNIAEGSSRSSLKDYNRFIEISLGSCFEAETQLLIARKLQYGNQSLIDSTLLLPEQEEKMITSFSVRLKGTS